MNRRSQFSGFSKNFPMRRSNLYTTNFIKIENICERKGGSREEKKGKRRFTGKHSRVLFSSLINTPHGGKGWKRVEQEWKKCGRASPDLHFSFSPCSLRIKCINECSRESYCTPYGPLVTMDE